MPFLPPNQQRQSTEGPTKKIQIQPKLLNIRIFNSFDTTSVYVVLNSITI